MKVTMRDIARECGVSYYTVSSVLHGRSDVGADTRKRVWATIKRLNYDPLKNMPLAQRVRARTMVLILPDNSASRDPFYQRAVTVAVAEASTRQYGCAVFSEQPALEVIGADPLRIHAYDGVLVFCPRQLWDDALRSITERGVPAVLVRRHTDVPGVAVISDDDRAGMATAVDHVYGLGHRRIGFIGTGTDRAGAFTAALDARGCECGSGRVLNVEGMGEPALQSRLSRLTVGAGAVTAFVCASDRLAAMTIKLFDRLGKKVPADVSVTGYNNDYISEIFNPGITSVEIPVEDMVRQGFRALCNMADGQAAATENQQMSNTLFVRASTGPVK